MGLVLTQSSTALGGLSGVLVHDDFTGAAATLAGRSPDTVDNGNTWENTLEVNETTGTGEATADKALGRTAVSAIETSVSDYTINGSIAVSTVSSQHIGFSMNVVDGSNYARFRYVPNGSPNPTMFIEGLVGGSVVDSDSVRHVVGGGIQKEVVITKSGSTFSSSFEGQDLSFNATTTNTAATKHGITTVEDGANNLNASVGYFKVTA